MLADRCLDKYSHKLILVYHISQCAHCQRVQQSAYACVNCTIKALQFMGTKAKCQIGKHFAARCKRISFKLYLTLESVYDHSRKINQLRYRNSNSSFKFKGTAPFGGLTFSYSFEPSQNYSYVISLPIFANSKKIKNSYFVTYVTKFCNLRCN